MNIKQKTAAALGALFLGAQVGGWQMGSTQGSEAMDAIAASGKGFTLTAYHEEVAAAANKTPLVLEPVRLMGIAPYSLALAMAPTQ